MELPNVKYRELDLSSVPQSRKDTIHGLIVQTLFGFDDKPYFVASLDQFKRLFGGYDADAAPYFPQIKRAIARGVRFYIQRLVASNAVAATHAFSGNNVTLSARTKGDWANNQVGFTLTVAPTFKLTLTYAADPTMNEVHEAATFADLATIINRDSNLIICTLGGGYTVPAAVSTLTYLSGGSDGSWADTAAKDTAINALYPKFNDIVDMDTISQLGTFTKAGVENLAAYVALRGDVMGVFEVDPASNIAAAKTFLTDDTTGLGAFKSNLVVGYYGSKLTAWSPEAQDDLEGPVLLDVLSVWSQSDTMMGNRLYPPAGPQRGMIDGVKTFSINLLSPARTAEVNELVNASVNIVGSHPNFGPVVWGAKTMNRMNSALDDIHTRRMLLDLRKNLTPIYQRGLFQINEPSAWRAMYVQAKPILDELVRAKVIAPAYHYVGDQDVSRISDVVYNTVTDLGNGIYKVKIVIVPFGYIETIELTVIANSLTGLITIE